MAIDGSDEMKKHSTTVFVFMEHTESMGGLLPDDRRAHACWYYCRLAHKHMQKVDEGGTYVGDLDTVNLLNNIARSVALFYKIGSPDEFLKFMHYCKSEVTRVGGSWDSRIERPDIHPFRREAN